MASAQEVQDELSGGAPGSHHETSIWRNVKAWAAKPRSVQDKLTRLLREWTEEAAIGGVHYDVGREGVTNAPVGPRNALYRLLFEATLWVKRAPLASLRARRGRPDTVLGHARDAASYGDVIDRKLDRIAAALEVDLDDIE